MLHVSAIKTNKQKGAEELILQWNKKYKFLNYFYDNPKYDTFTAFVTP
jgi:hypothetical protein